MKELQGTKEETEKRKHNGPAGISKTVEELWALRVSQEMQVKHLDTRVEDHVDPGNEKTAQKICQGITYLPNGTRVQKIQSRQTEGSRNNK
eukprot:10204064-Ditylum_brightwellii.AAC.1